MNQKSKGVNKIPNPLGWHKRCEEDCNMNTYNRDEDEDEATLNIIASK